MDDKSKPGPLDYESPPPRAPQTFKILGIIVASTIVSLIVAFIAASFLMPAAGGGH